MPNTFSIRNLIPESSNQLVSHILCKKYLVHKYVSFTRTFVCLVKETGDSDSFQNPFSKQNPSLSPKEKTRGIAAHEDTGVEKRGFSHLGHYKILEVGSKQKLGGIWEFRELWCAYEFVCIFSSVEEITQIFNHVRPCKTWLRTAGHFQSDIRVRKCGRTQAKSVQKPNSTRDLHSPAPVCVRDSPIFLKSLPS